MIDSQNKRTGKNKNVNIKKNDMKAIIRFYKNWIGIRFKPKKMIGSRKGYYTLIARHPNKSITWIWSIYYDSRLKWYKRIYIMTQKPMWRK